MITFVNMTTVQDSGVIISSDDLSTSSSLNNISRFVFGEIKVVDTYSVQ